jgi:hypothetical protein
MCNCVVLPIAVVDILCSETRFNFQGKVEFQPFFESLDSENYLPDLDYSKHHYKCMECGQFWYIENSADQNPAPIFAMKYNGLSYEPTIEEIRAEKDFLLILAHRGFSSTTCRVLGCNNKKLKGREICFLHLSLP